MTLYKQAKEAAAKCPGCIYYIGGGSRNVPVICFSPLVCIDGNEFSPKVK